LAYIFDPERNTFIDDEDTSLGNKLALIDNDELDKAIKQLDDKFGPGTTFPASEAPTPPKTIDRDMYKNAFKESAADGGLMRQNFVVPGLVFAPQAIATMAAITGLGIEAVRRYAQANPDLATNLLENFKTNSANLKDNVLAFVDGVHGEKSEETKKIEKAGRVETLPIQEDYSASFGGKGTEIPEQTKQEPPVSGGLIEFPPSTGGTEIIEPKKGDNIFFNKKKERGEKALEEIDPETLTDINTIIKDYRNSKTRPAGIYTESDSKGKTRERFRPASTQPIMNEADKVELLELVIKKYKEKENKLPSGTELTTLLPSLNVSSLAKKNKIELGKRTADYDRNDPKYIESQRENKQLKANENSTITNFANENFFPDTVELKDGSTVNAKEFFINNLVKRTELGPSRIGTYDTTLKNKELAKLFNTNIRKIEEVIKNIRNSPDFQADYPPRRPENYANQEAAKTLKDAREYAKSLPNGELHVQNVLIQENKRIPNLNNLFKNETLKITDYPKIVEDLNTTMDKKTGIIDKTITKTKKELIDRSKKDKGIFQVFHNVPKSSKQKNIEFLSNRYISLYKTNAGFVKSAESYIKNQKDNVDYKERVEDFDNYLKERGLRIKIDNKFYGIDFQEMINSETGEFTGMNRTLEYYGLPKFKNGVPLTKVKKADGGSIELSPMPRVGFNGGGAVGADDNFAKELEYFLLNQDAELPKAESYRETMNPVALLNDMIDPRNYAYYADRLAETGIRIGEFGARILPALGQLTADLIKKPAFKVTGGTGQGYVQDYDEVLPSNIKGTGIFTEFLNNLVGSEGTKVITEKTGLAELIRSQEQKQKDRRSTIGPKILADQVTLGAELTAPIFPGLKLLKAYAKNRKLPVDNTTKEIMEKEIDEVLSAQNLTRRNFLKATGAGGAIVLAKMLGFGDELATTTKVVEKATKEAATGGVPPYFLNLVKKIKTMGDETMATKDKATAYKYDDYYMEEDFAGNIEITRKGDMDVPGYEEVYMSYRVDEVPIKGEKGSRKVEEYEEYTARPDEDGKMKDVEDGVPDDVIEEGTMFEDNMTDFNK
jgi:hypothetical protein